MGSLAVCELRALALVGGLALRLLLREKRCHRCEAGLELAGGARVPLAPRPPHPARQHLPERLASVPPVEEDQHPVVLGVADEPADGLVGGLERLASVPE